LLIKILTYISGFVRVSVTGRFVERFLNICMNRNIKVWDIKKRGSDLLHLNLTPNGFKSIPPVAYKSKTKVRIISRHGLPFVLHKHKKRKAFFIGGIVFALLIGVVTSFVWVVDVEGNEKVSAGEIMQSLEKHGLKAGSFRYGHDIADLQNRMMLEIKELSWIWVDIKGTRAIVEVKEKTPVPEIVDKNMPCNIVASADGLITEINATYGQRMVNVGDVVRKGDLLISGISNTKYDGIHYLHSLGEVKARTWHTKTTDYPLKKVDFLKTGKKISKNTINFFGFRVKLYLDGTTPYEYHEEETVVHKLHIGKNLVLPLFFERQIFYELQKEETALDVPSALKLAEAKLYGELDKELSEGSVTVNKTCKIMHEGSEHITVKAEYECIEDIGATVVITKE